MRDYWTLQAANVAWTVFIINAIARTYGWLGLGVTVFFALTCTLYGAVLARDVLKKNA